MSIADGTHVPAQFCTFLSITLCTCVLCAAVMRGWKKPCSNVMFAESRDTREYTCGLVDLDIAGIAGLFGNKMLRSEAAPQEVDNPAEVFTGRPGVAL